LSLRLVSQKNYGIALETVVNVFWRLPPRVTKVPMMKTAMRAAIRPYSMAVTPDSGRDSARLKPNPLKPNPLKLA